MTSRKPRHRIIRLFGLGTAAAAVVVLAGALPVPREGTLEPPPLAANLQVQVDTPPPDPSAGPVFIPYTTAPRLKNGPVIQELLRLLHPDELRSAGIGGTARAWLFVDVAGAVRAVQLKESSEHAALDEAALLVAEAMEFTPALNREVPTAVWVDLPIVFRSAADSVARSTK